MLKVGFVLVALAAFLSSAICEATNGKAVAVLIESQSIRTTHSRFFDSLKSRGFELKFLDAGDSNLKLDSYGEFLFDHLVIFAPTIKTFGGRVDAGKLLNFVDAGRNLIVAGGAHLSKTLRELALQCGVEFDSAGAYAIDHHAFDASDDDGDHTLLVATDVLNVTKIVGTVAVAPVLFKGAAMRVERSELLFPVLRGAATSYSGTPTRALLSEPLVAGARTTLIAALQARNNARVLFSGSLDFFGDDFFTRPVQGQLSGNEKLAVELSKWALAERGILRASNALYHHSEKVEGRGFYRVNDTVSFEVDIHQWDGAAWAPYVANDVQLEFRMLDPYVRIALAPSSGGHYNASFVLPDVHGVFSFHVDYHRAGFGRLAVSERVTVHPYRHDGAERHIESAYPYYASVFSMMGGVFVFSVVFLYHREK